MKRFPKVVSVGSTIMSFELTESSFGKYELEANIWWVFASLADGPGCHRLQRGSQIESLRLDEDSDATSLPQIEDSQKTLFFT